MTAHAAGSCDSEHHCITCSDEGVPMRVLRVDDARGLALCEREDGVHATVETALVDGVGPGALVLVHAAVALALLEDAA
ncbi:MAG: HupF/HypC family [Solirubrobacteraceae bacterium]|jgi:hydrogenase maturation factor|nr:HupF/HypC family [Solirubrobacteraceae bacterium]